MDKKAIQEEVAKLLEEMENLVLDAGVGAKRYKMLKTKIDRRQLSTLLRMQEFLNKVYVGSYAEVHRIWTLPSMTEEVWFNYLNLFSDTTFEEVDLLKVARRKLKADFVTYYKEKN